MADVNVLGGPGISTALVHSHVRKTYFPVGGLSALPSRSVRREPVGWSLNDLFMLLEVDLPARYLTEKLSARPCDAFLTNIALMDRRGLRPAGLHSERGKGRSRGT